MARPEAQPERLSPVYSAQGSLLLLSRAWNLCRLNLSVGFMVMALPAFLQVCLTIAGSLLSRMTQGGFLTASASGSRLLLFALSGLVLFVGWVFYGFIWAFCACVLARFYYSALLRERPLPLKECLRFVLARIVPVGLLLLVIIPASMAFTLLNGFALLFGGVVSTIVMAQFPLWAAPLLAKSTAALMAVLFLLFWGFLILTGVTTAACLQGFALVFPILAVATASPSEPVLASVRLGLRQVFASVWRLTPFTLALLLLASAMVATMIAPVAFLSVWGLKASLPGHAPVLSMPAAVLLNVTRGLIELLAGPFIISALVFFWYDCRVRSDGLDLSLRLERLRLRRRPGAETGLFS